MYGQPNWVNNPTGRLFYLTQGGTIRIQIVFSESNEEGSNKLYRWEYTWHLKVVNDDTGQSKEVTSRNDVVVGEDPGCGDPTLQLGFTENELGRGDGWIKIWIYYEKHDISNGGDIIVCRRTLPGSDLTWDSGIKLTAGYP